MQKHDSEFRWYAITGEGPEWRRSVAVDTAGTIYVPGAIVGEQQALLCAGFDGVAMVMDDDRAYFPLEWMRREFPETAELCGKIERRIKEELK